MEKTELIVSNKMIANNVKKLYAERLNLSLSKFKIRFLYRGKEIMNHHSLSLYNLDSNSKIQVSINEI